MVAVPSGSFVMGSDAFYPEEAPAHEERVDGFLMDDHPVTNAEFHRFVRATGYVTVAEQRPDPVDFDEAEPADLVAGSLVFRQADGPVPLDDWRRWWHWVPGARWTVPAGPGSGLGGRDRHPVVHLPCSARSDDWSVVEPARLADPEQRHGDGSAVARDRGSTRGQGHRWVLNPQVLTRVG
jgi:formylglycine-generating enzyme required for sulfatase activity